MILFEAVPLIEVRLVGRIPKLLMKFLQHGRIVERLKAQGIELARRTVAKYRKILSIPTARQRRKY